MAKYVWVFAFSHRSDSLDKLLRDPKTAGLPDTKLQGTPLQPGSVPANLDCQCKTDPPDHYLWAAVGHKEVEDAKEYVRSGGGKDLLTQPEFKSCSLFEIE